MSSNIQVQRICQHCHTEFTARTTVTRYCSDKCSKRAYKERIKTGKIERSNTETKAIKHGAIESIKQREYLNVRDAAILIGCSVRTVYRLIDSGGLVASNISERMTRIRRAEIDKLLSVPTVPASKEKEILQSFTWPVEDCYSMKEILTKYPISEKALYDVLKRNKVPRKKDGWYTYVPKVLVDKLLN
ncbi:MAG: helix-turn-helix domain-containing protein [Leadbetterella sp.]|nr:helix-turn-helix domain-containing protein [Leadbetterella sp.]